MSDHSVVYRIWRITFFPVTILALFIVVGMKGVISIACFGLIVFALRYVPLGGSRQLREQR